MNDDVKKKKKKSILKKKYYDDDDDDEEKIRRTTIKTHRSPVHVFSEFLFFAPHYHTGYQWTLVCCCMGY